MSPTRTILVGNGPSLLDIPRGKQIDEFECVVRFNNYKMPTDLLDFTGTKTDLVAVNCGLLDGSITVRKGLPILMAVPWWKPTEGCLWWRMADLGYDMIDERISRDLTRWYPKPGWPSTGMLTIGHFTYEEPRVAIVGFDCFLGTRHHYVDTKPFCGNHNPKGEKTYLTYMIAGGCVVALI